MSIWSTISSFFRRPTTKVKTLSPRKLPGVKVIDVTSTPPGGSGPDITGSVTVRRGGSSGSRTVTATSPGISQEQAQRVAEESARREAQRQAQRAAEQRKATEQRAAISASQQQNQTQIQQPSSSQVEVRGGKVFVGRTGYIGKAIVPGTGGLTANEVRQNLAREYQKQSGTFVSPTRLSGELTFEQRQQSSTDFVFGGGTEVEDTGELLVTGSEIGRTGEEAGQGFRVSGVEPKPTFGSVRTALKSGTYGEAFKEIFPALSQKISQTPIAQRIQRKAIERYETEQLYKIYKSARVKPPAELEYKQQQIYAGRLVSVGLLAMGLTPITIMKPLVIDRSIVSVGVQRATGSNAVETRIAFSTTDKSLSGFVGGTAQKIKGGLIKTELRGVVGKAGKPITKATEFRVDTLGKASSRKGVNVLYDTPTLKVSGKGGRVGAFAEAGVFKVPATGRSFIQRYGSITTRFRPVITEIPSKVFKQPLVARSLDIGSQRVRLVAGDIAEGTTFAGYIYRVPTQPLVTRIMGTRGGTLKTFQIVDKQLYDEALKTALASASKSVTTPSTRITSLPSTKTTAIVSQQQIVQPSAFAGTGLYERTEGGMVPQLISQDFRLTGGISPQLISQDFRLTSVQVQSFSPVSRTISRTRTTQVVVPSQRTDTIQRVVPIQKIVQRQIPSQAQEFIQVQKQQLIQKPIIPKPIIPKPIIPKIPIPIFPRLKPTKTPRSQPFKFPVLVRRFGKFKVVGFGRTPGQAVKIGTDVVSKTLARTFRVPGFKGTRLPGFRTKKEKEGFVFIEPSKRALGTPTEIKEITSFRIAKQKPIVPKIKPIKINTNVL
jgi:hypothetical protein